MEKRLFFRDPSTGIELPLQVYRVNTNTITELGLNKQDKTDGRLKTADKTVVGAINEIDASLGEMLRSPFTAPEREGRPIILSLDASDNVVWRQDYGGMSRFDIVDTGSGDAWSVGTMECGTFLDDNDFCTFFVRTPEKPNGANCTVNGILMTLNGSGVPAGYLDSSALYIGAYDSEENSIEIYDIEGMNKVAQNLTPNLILKETQDDDIEAYSKVEMDEMLLDASLNVNDQRMITGRIEQFSESVQYKLNDYCKHEGMYYRCIVNQFSGAWADYAWVQITLVSEISGYRHVGEQTYERISIKVSCSNGASVAGNTVTIAYSSESGKPSETITLDATGLVEKDIEHGISYTVSVNDKLGFIPPVNQMYYANQIQRSIVFVYKYIVSGVFVIDNDGNEIEIDKWNTADNDRARFIKYTSNQLNPEEGPDNSIIISKLWESQYNTSKVWCQEYYDVPGLPNI